MGNILKSFNEHSKNENLDLSDDKIILTLTKEEAEGLLSCLIRTSANGDALTIGMKIEDRLVKLLK